MLKRTRHILLGATLLALLAPLAAFAARTNDLWVYQSGTTYLQTNFPSGLDILINGSNRYLNWNTVTGSSGYGLRDNGGTLEFKNSGGSWAGIGSGSGGGGSGNVATSTTETAGFLSYWTSTGATPATLGKVATGTISGSGLVGVTAGQSIIGSGLTVSLSNVNANTVLGNPTGASAAPTAFATSSLFQNASASASGLLTSTDWSTFNNKQATIAATWPVILTGATLSFGGLSTSSAAVIGNIPYYSGVNTFANVATGTVSAGSSAITVTASRYVIGGALAIDCAGATASQNGCLSSTDWSTFNNKISWGAATSTSANQSVYTNAFGKLVSVATSTPTISSGLSYSGTTFGDVVGGGSGSLTCVTGSNTVFGCLTAANFLTFTNKIGTSSNATAGNLAYFTTTNGTPALIADVATGTVSAGSSAITVTAGRSAIGGALAIDCAGAGATQNGCLSAANFNVFNNKVATSAKETAGQLAVWGTTSGTPPQLYSLATSSATCSTGVGCTGFNVLGSNAITFTNTYGYPFTSGTTYNVANQGTTTPIWFQGNGTWGIFASSTSVFDNATTTQLTVSGASWFKGITADRLLSVDVNGKLYGSATSSETCTAPLSCTAHGVLTGGGAISVPNSTVTADGYLSAANFQVFNNKVGTTSAKETAGQVAIFGSTSGTPALIYGISTSSASCSTGVSCTSFNVLGSNAITFTNVYGYPWTSATTYNTVSQSTTTPIWFQGNGTYGIFASSTSVFNYASTTAFSASNLVSGNCVQASTGGMLTTTAGACGVGGFSWPFTPGTYGATADQATSTLYLNTVGIVAQGTSTIGNGTQTTGLTINGGATTSLAFSAGADGFNVSATGAITKLGGSAVSVTSANIQLGSSGGDVLLQNNVSTLGSRVKIQTTPVVGGNTDPNSAITFFIGLIERARFTGNGFLGIGTTSPSALLDINTMGGASGASTTLFRIASSTATATTTLFQVNNVGVASTTNLTVSLLNAAACDVKADTNGVFSCGTDATSAGGGTYPFVPATTYNIISSGTSTPLWLQGSPYALFASSTSVFSNASTTQLTIGGTSWISTITDKILGTDVNGKVFGAATSTASCSSGVSCTSFGVFGAGAISITNTGVTNAAAGTGVAVSAATGAVTFSLASLAANSLYMNATGAAAVPTVVATSSIFSGAAGNVGFFSSSGNLVGTSTLTISAGGFAGISTTTPFGLFSIGQSAVTPSFWVGNQGSSTPSFVILGVNGNGNIGIGTSSPFASFTLAASSSIQVSENLSATSTAIADDWRQGNSRLIQIGTSAITITFSGFIAGATHKAIVCNPSVGTPGALTWAATGSSVEWAGGTAPTATSAVNQCDVYSFIATQATSTTGAIKIFGAISTGFK